ncbi:Rv3654c family TadE-like protein [Nocardioides sp. 1609]|uniref:Rv3654c family TadE-like protein n=1 Tax=Nocardioides sp. 1609 TaxID=2508327 RepID=UPI00106F9A24|nr:Rv3654c family TadE-like protein [Nocardioides sp. 1609]
MTRGTGQERGGATVVTLALAGVLLLVGAALGVVAALVVGHRTAQAAADLAALAAAQSLARGSDGCGAAATVAAANGATVTACSVEGRDVRVVVEVAGPRWLGQSGDLAAQARAGPAQAR